MIITWVTGVVYDDPYFLDFNYGQDDQYTARPIMNMIVKSIEFVGETFGTRVPGVTDEDIDLWVLPETEVVYRGAGTDCEATVLDGRPSWFGSLETARKYVVEGGGVAAFRATEPLPLFDLFSAKNARMLLKHHAHDADLCALITRVTGFTGVHDKYARRKGRDSHVLEILDPNVPVEREKGARHDFLRTIMHDGKPADVVMLPDNKLYHRVDNGEYVEIPVLECVDLGSHLAGRCEMGFERASGDTASDTRLLNAIKDMCDARFADVGVVGYHGAKTFNGNEFHAEIALFDTSGLQKHCDFDADGGGARRISWLSEAALVAVVLASSVLGAAGYM
jgi:hypothetical protein